MSLIADLFGHSPIRPMQEHMRAAVECARQILPLFEEMIAGDTAAVTARHQAIDRLEHEADRIKNEINRLLRTKSGFKPYEKLQKIDFLKNEFTVGDELTNTFKKRRHVIERKYRELIDRLFK